MNKNDSLRYQLIKKTSLFFFVFFVASHYTAIEANSRDPKQTKVVTGKKILPKDTILFNMPFRVEVKMEKELLYDKHTLEDEYTYQKINREFQWEKIEKRLAFLDSLQQRDHSYAILQNYKDRKGKAPFTRDYKKDDYNKFTDKYGVERFQGIPLYYLKDTLESERYGLDGSWVKIIDFDSTSNWVDVQLLSEPSIWTVPKNYVKVLNDSVRFRHVAFVDVKNQNIATVEKVDSKWLIRSMNPITSGKHSPPHMKETPLGIFVLQEKKAKMYYLVDGTQTIAGFAPYASRFSGGGYLHGVPLVNPNTQLIEYSWTLGTVPRSHMCVRNATSHAKFIYDWAPIESTLIFVIN